MPAFALIFMMLLSPLVKAASFSTMVDDLSLSALELTFSESKVASVLGSSGKDLTKDEQRAAAVLVSAGILSPDDLLSVARVASKYQQFRQSQAGKSDHLIGPFGASVTHTRLNRIGDHSELLKEQAFITSLQQLLSQGVITGYDLRKVNINDGFDPQKTLTYSHSSIVHLKQLSTLLKSEGVDGLLYAAPKISAFLFRDEWGEPPDNVEELKDGTRVVNGKEWVVFFEFESSVEKSKFHRVVTTYAKKDLENQPGLIADAWWQPFYYSETLVEDFAHINLVLLKSNTTEATLTVLPEKVMRVKSALDNGGWEITVEDVWVNKPFYRFLQGGYK
tara:strand:- start:23500 stop:24501 length:1002 start_codon:yes stop_codon:yes gene_type:complete